MWGVWQGVSSAGGSAVSGDQEEGGDLYLVNGNLCKLEDAGLFAGKNLQEPETTDGRMPRQGGPGQGQ